MTTQPFLFSEVIGLWIGTFLTFCILSFLYKDNPFYKMAEHLFVGSSIGIVVLNMWYGTLKPELWQRLVTDKNYWYIIALVLVAMLFVGSISRGAAWVRRYPIAFVVGVYAGINVPSVANSNLLIQTQASAADVISERADLNNASIGTLRKLPGFGTAVAQKVIDGRPYKSYDQLLEPFRDSKTGAVLPPEKQLSERQRLLVGYALSGPRGIQARSYLGEPGAKPEHRYYWFAIFSSLLMLAGTISALVYFYFSVPHKGVVGKVARFGVWTLMIGFGASFGYTVQGRIALAIGRAFSIFDYDKAPVHRSQVQGPYVALISIAIIVIGIAFIENKARKNPPPDDDGDGSDLTPSLHTESQHS